MKKAKWRGFTLQLFIITVLPLSALLLVVAFGSQSLHHEAMRSLVGDRDLRTVLAASSSLEKELSHLSSTIQILSRSLNERSDLNSLILNPEEISSIFDGGIALITSEGRLIQSTTSEVDWQTISEQIPDSFDELKLADSPPVFSPPIFSENGNRVFVFISTVTDQNNILVGAFSPERIIEHTIGNFVGSGELSVLVVSPTNQNGEHNVLYRSGSYNSDQNDPSHPGIQEVLTGESGINYFQSDEEEHVVAFSPVFPTGWGLIIEEAWEDIASPYLINTQSAPLVLVPVFLLALIALWFGARRIVTPLQKLEKQAISLASGDYDAIQNPVGGIEEIRNLQTELIEMAQKVKIAQQNLRGYIGAITAGVENERRSIARELHDDTIQALIALNQKIQMIMMDASETQRSSIKDLQMLVQQSITNLRRMIRGLRPIYLEDLGLVASLEMLVREMEQTSNIQIIFNSKGNERRLDPQSEMSLYRIAQESLNNVVQHANAEHAWVDLEFSDNDIFLQIRDDGCGFIVPANSAEFPKRGHFGLLGLKERSDLIKADFRINSNLGAGTTITIRLKNIPPSKLN
jgi:signal transduction histidine kinase